MRQPSRELFTVKNDHWAVTESEQGLYTLLSRGQPDAKLGPMEGEQLVGVLAVISELDRHLREGR